MPGRKNQNNGQTLTDTKDSAGQSGGMAQEGTGDQGMEDVTGQKDTTGSAGGEATEEVGEDDLGESEKDEDKFEPIEE